MAVELATAYVSLVADASKIPGQAKQAFGDVEKQAAATGTSSGEKLSGGIGKALKGGALAVGVAAGGTLATAFAKGMGRLTAIDDAQAKLAGLGNDTKSVAAIMDSALASVKGTAYGLGDAAGVAASAVAAGIKPGEELTKYLKLTADAATIAGSSLGEMGAIVNKVQTSGHAFTDNLNQLADRGIPIFQWLQDEYKVSADELGKMVSAGKVDAATFQKVIQENIGGAALKSGDTVKGAFNNVEAALGRLGAAALKPTFSRLSTGLTGTTGLIDKVTPKIVDLAGALDSKIFDDFAPRIQKAWASFKDSDIAKGSIASITGVVQDLLQAGKDAAPAIGAIVKSLSTAGAAIGISTWQSLLAALDAAASIANGVLVPALQTVSSLMDDNQVAVVALVAAWVGFKTLPSLISRVGDSISPVTSKLRGFGDTMKLQQKLAENAGASVGKFGAAVGALQSHVPVLDRVGTSYRSAADGAERFGRTAGTVAGSLTAIRSAGSGIVGMLGGWAGIGLAAGGALLAANASSAGSAKSAQNALTEAVTAGAKAQSAFRAAVGAANGALNDQAIAASGEIVKSVLADITTLGERGHTNSETFGHTIDNLTGNVLGLNNAWEENYDKVTANVERNDALKKVLSDMKLNVDDLGKVVAEGGPQYDQLTGKLRETGDAGSAVADKLGDARNEIRQAQDEAKNSTPGFFGLQDAVKVLADESSTAADRLGAMKRALDVLSGKPVELGDAMQSYNKTVRETAAAAGALADQSKGYGDALVNADGSVNTATENGDKLRTTLTGLLDATLDVAKSGGDLGPIFAQNDQAFVDLAASTGLSITQLKEMAAQIGYMPDKIEILAELKGAKSSEQQLVVLRGLLDSNAEGVEIPVSALTDEARAELDKAGAKVDEVTGKPGVIKISAPNEAVLKKLQEVIDKNIPDKRFNIIANSQGAEARLAAFGAAEVSGPLPVYRAAGGAVRGPGGPTSDSIPAMLSDNEHVLTSDEVDAAGGHGAIYALRQRIRAGALRRAEGGAVSKDGIQAALDAGRSKNGHEYVWGATGPDNFDCSGWVGWLQQIVMGIVGSTKRLYTTYSLLDGATEGLEPGLGPAGTLFQVGVSQEHMAATIAGHDAESGGAYGTSGIDGGRANAQDSQFPYKFHLPNSLIAGFRAGGKYGKKAKLAEWDDDKELDLESAKLAVEKAQASRDKDYADAKKSDIDRRESDLEVKKAQQKVLELQGEKDEAANGVEGGPAPEAPALSKAYSDTELERIDLQTAVEDAKKRRNEVYADLEATDTDRLKADADLARAQNKMAKGVDGEGFELKGRLRDYVTQVAGIGFDAVLGQLPEGIGDSRFWDIDYSSLAPKRADGTDALPQPPLFSDRDIAGQLGYTPKAGVDDPEWVKAGRRKAPKVFDTGGWLEPGEMGINLSSKPEPIFNSPDQLRKFAGGGLEPAASSGVSLDDLKRVLQNRPNVTFQVSDMREAMKQYQTEMRLQSRSYTRR
ncbi:tape measure protein [Antrihabitans cavernicola]|uniref:Tape measure protein N-terminal domain-containing protein n=1 Tax=Antrihabitans cavernicola TaxID=2495913 RepID=A0A5A7S336_9NOCA|nr:tape measure protein [Spelaeibacter cavernicola]KAA0016748.1 hypothetical protein FOY51_25720 [Spelaeibacter cavernicola]